MSNVFSNTEFAVLSVMENHADNSFLGATAFVQRKPEANYGNILTVSFSSNDFAHEDFNVQARFDDNVAANIHQQIRESDVVTRASFKASNSNLSVKSYRMTAVENT